MALESLRDNIFSTQSDIWSFGVVLWEIFSLSAVPYPGMRVDERFIHRLETGYRIPKPFYSSNDIYALMIECWKSDPRQRPAFHILAEALMVQRRFTDWLPLQPSNDSNHQHQLRGIVTLMSRSLSNSSASTNSSEEANEDTQEEIEMVTSTDIGQKF